MIRLNLLTPKSFCPCKDDQTPLLAKLDIYNREPQKRLINFQLHQNRMQTP